MIRFALDRDDSTMVTDNSVNYRQAQAGAFGLPLGGEKRVKDAIHGLLIHSVAVIPDGQTQVMARQQVAEIGNQLAVVVGIVQPDIQLAERLTPHGMDGIGAKIHYYLLNLGWISEHQAQFFIDMKPDLDRGHQGCPQKFKAFAHDHVNPDLLPLLLTLTAEGKYLLAQVLSSQT